MWPEGVRDALANIDGVNFDKARLLSIASENLDDGPFVLTFLTKELLQLGIMWAHFAVKAGVKRFAIAAMDAETVDALQKQGIPAIEVHLPATLSHMVDYQNRNGFNGKALAVIYCRTQLIKFLLENGVDVVSCDVDALFDKQLDPNLTREQMIAFQRVAYLPRPLSKIWGFTACGGFIAYRACGEVVSFISRVLAIQQEVSSDQVALNLAILEENVKWECELPHFQTQENVNSGFAANAAQGIRGVFPRNRLTLTALPATQFWRHTFVPLDRKETTLIHPNSPKSIEGKLEVFGHILDKNELDILLNQVA